MNSIQKLFVVALVFLLIIPGGASAETGYSEATIFYNEACHHCAMHIDNVLVPILEESGVRAIKKDYVNVRTHRQELNELNERLGVPLKLQGHIATFIDDKIILGGMCRSMS